MIKALNSYYESKSFKDIEVEEHVQYAFEEFMNNYHDLPPCTWSGELWESGEWLFQAIAQEYGQYAGVCMFNEYKPERPFRENENLFNMETEDETTPRCLKTECAYHEKNRDTSWMHCSYATYITGCIDNVCASLITTFIIGGWSGLKEFEEEGSIHPEVFRFLERNWDNDYIGLREFEIYGTVNGKVPVDKLLTPFNEELVKFAEDNKKTLNKRGEWFIRIGMGEYIKVENYKWTLDTNGDIVLRINEDR